MEKEPLMFEPAQKKYRITEEKIWFACRTLYRIEAMKDFNDVRTGQKGGFIEKEENLSQKGNCWVYDDAKVFDDAKVYEHARLFNKAHIGNNAKVHGNACICENAVIYEHANIYGNTSICGNASVSGYAIVKENARIDENAFIYSHASICGSANITGSARITGTVTIRHTYEYIVFKNNFSSGRYFTYTLPNKMWSAGCFYGTGKELIEKAKKDYKGKAKCYKLYVDLVEKLEKLYPFNTDTEYEKSGTEH